MSRGEVNTILRSSRIGDFIIRESQTRYVHAGRAAPIALLRARSFSSPPSTHFESHQPRRLRHQRADWQPDLDGPRH